MRRYALLILFAVVLIAPFVLRLAVGKQARSVPKGALTLVVITPHQESIRREFAEAFSNWHESHLGRPVFVDYRSYGASDMVKVFKDRHGTMYKAHGTYQIDVAWGGGDAVFEEQLKKPGYLQPLPLALVDPEWADPSRACFPKDDLGGVALLDRADPPSWFGAALSSFGIVYNKDLCRHLGAGSPATWRDLADPRYRGWIALADPTRSGSAKQTYMVIVERAMADAAAQGRTEDDGWADGMGLVRQIAANARLFTESSSTVPIQVSTGDAAAGMAIDFYGRSQSDAVGDARMGYVEPAGATAINPDPIALVKGAQNRELAILFIRFVLSEQGQRLWNIRAGAPGGPAQTTLRRLPIRPSVYRDMTHFADRVDPYRAAGGFNKSSAREKTWGILGDLIQMSCIDALEELRDTRQAILASPRAAELDAKLGRFPFDQREALRRLAQWKQAKGATLLELQRRWTAEFRDEYRRLREEAAK